jgi:PAS domain S-box-containing protein
MGDPATRRLVQGLDHVAVLGLGAGGTLFFWNRGAEQLLGHSTAAVLGRDPVQVLAAEEDRARLRELLGGGARTPVSGICQLLHRDGSRVPVLLHHEQVHGDDDRPAETYTFATPLRAETGDRAHLQLLQTQKLESLAVLAGGIAHDFNNLLLGVVGNADLMLLELSEDHPAHEPAEQIAQAGLRAADLCRQLLAFSGKGQVLSDEVDLTDLVQSLAPLLHMSLGGSRLHLDLATALPPVTGDPEQLRQVIVNLVTNAAEALTDDPGAITIRTRSHDAAADPLANPVTGAPLPEGTYAMVEVADTGCGIAPEHLERVFEPFFTTKFLGRGLGLAAAQGIVRAHHGTVRVASAPGNGATFTVLLPAVGVRGAPLAGTDQQPAAATEQAPDVETGQRRILVVDDEEHVRRVASQLLQADGYAVTAVTDGEAAIELLENDPRACDLVLLDMTMPGFDGLEVLRAIRRLRRDLPVLLSSGYGRERVRHVLAEDDACAFIQKPYRRRELLGSTGAMLGLRGQG